MNILKYDLYISFLIFFKISSLDVIAILYELWLTSQAQIQEILLGVHFYMDKLIQLIEKKFWLSSQYDIHIYTQYQSSWVVFYRQGLWFPEDLAKSMIASFIVINTY